MAEHELLSGTSLATFEPDTAVATIVSEYIRRPGTHFVDLEDLRTIILTVRKAFADPLEEPMLKEPELPPEPAVPIKKSIHPDYLTCLEDGKQMKMLKRHLMTNYNMTPEEYRARWKLPPDYPMVAPNYAAKRSEMAKQFGLGKRA